MSKKEDNKVVAILGTRGKGKKNESESKSEAVFCSFCNRSNALVVKMIQGPGVNICSECTMIAVQYLILEDKMPSGESQKILEAFWRGCKK